MILFFSILNLLLLLLLFSIIYYDICDMSSENIPNVGYDNIMMIFNMSTSYFHKISFHYFEDYLMMKLTLG
jgi:hypothetical protein